MLDAKKLIKNLKPAIANFSKKSGFFAKKFIKAAKKKKINKEKIKKIINALDESKLTRKWIRAALISVIGALIIKKIIDVYY
jgi:hypothetical protein